MDTLLQEVYDAILDGNRARVEERVRLALDANTEAQSILQSGMITAMDEVGRRFEEGVLYVPEMLVSARAMQAGLALLKPHLAQTGVEARCKVVIGSVKGDLHDIGKNLVGMMLEGAGFEIVDLGTDVPPVRFASAIRETGAKIVGMSALLTTTMVHMRSTVEAIDDIGMRSQVVVLVGGAPVTESYAREIGADGYASDASQAVRVARRLLDELPSPR